MVDYCIFTMSLMELGALRGGNWNGGGKMKMGNFSHQDLLGNDHVCFES